MKFLAVSCESLLFCLVAALLLLINFDDWTIILSSPLLITFAQTKALALPPIPSTTPFPWLVAKYFHEKAFVLLTEWMKELCHDFVFKLWWLSVLPCNIMYCTWMITVAVREVYKHYSILIFAMPIWHNY